MCRNRKRSLLIENERKKISKKQKKKFDISNMSTKKKVLLFIFICIGLGMLFEIITLIPFLKNYLQIISWIKKVLCSGFSIGTVLATIPALGNTKTNGKDIVERAYNGAKNIYDVLKDSAVFVVCFMVASILCVSSVFAAVHPVEATCTFVKESVKIDVDIHIDLKAGVKAVKDYYMHNESDNQIGDNSPPDNQEKEIKIVINDASEVNDAAANDEEWTSNHTPQEIELSQRLKLTNEQKEEVLHLSDDVKNRIYFNESRFEIKNWQNENEILTMVENKVDSLRLHGKKNEFDDDSAAPPSIKEEIAAASKKDESVSSLTDKLKITNLRDNTYKQYPKFTLAQLIAEDYNACGLSILYNGGQRVTAEYYFGNSIDWFMEMLKYKDISSATIKNILTSIAQRYDDIHYASNNDEADKLAEAFRAVASNYGNSE